MSVTVGKPIANFTAPSTAGTWTLADSPEYVVMYFYPRDNTPGCTTEGQDFGAHYSAFAAENCQIVGVSCDTIRKHQNFKKKFDFPFELISDTDEAVCTLFDVIKWKTLYGKKYRGIERSTFLIGPDRQLLAEWRKVKVPGHVEEVFKQLVAAPHNAR